MIFDIRRPSEAHKLLHHPDPKNLDVITMYWNSADLNYYLIVMVPMPEWIEFLRKARDMDLEVLIEGNLGDRQRGDFYYVYSVGAARESDLMLLKLSL